MTFKNRFYPHLLPVDIPVWERFLNDHEHEYLHFEYDIRVGNGRPAPPTEPGEIQKMALDLSRRRIDAVGYTRRRIDLIEITRVIDLKAIGQVTTYPILFNQTYAHSIPVRPVIVAEEVNTDIQPVIDYHNLTVFLFPA